MQFIVEAKKYIIDLVEKDFKTNSIFCAHSKENIKKTVKLALLSRNRLHDEQFRRLPRRT